MLITLDDGPRAGETFDIPAPAVRSGHVRIPVWPDRDFMGYGIAGIAVYEMRRYFPPWAGQCAMPLHGWFYCG